MKLKNREKTTQLVIHCSATKPDMMIGAKEITAWHKDRGWLTNGYHYVINRSARLELGRQEDAIGAGARGNNLESVHICMVGGVDAELKPDDNFTVSQYTTLRNVLILLRSRYPETTIYGHYELDNKKACPSFDVDRFLDVIDMTKEPTKTTNYLT
jgi:N-acetyl-anhydromuramyl-L-alanine amidase AmpD